MLRERIHRSAPPAPHSAIAEARRAAGLTEKELAARLGVSLWEMERIEQGQADLTPYLPRLEEATGSPQSRLASEQPREDEVKPAAEPQPPTVGDRRGTLWLVLGSIAALVLVRFFTEVPIGAATYGAVLFGLHRDRLLAFRNILRMARSPDS